MTKKAFIGRTYPRLAKNGGMKDNTGRVAERKKLKARQGQVLRIKLEGDNTTYHCTCRMTAQH